MFINIEAAQKRAEAAKIRAKAAEIRAKAAENQGRDAAKRKAIWMIVGYFFMLLDHPLLSGASLYFTLSCIGSIYSWKLYRQFDIHIFDFFDTSDFLLSAFQNPEAVIIGIGLTLFAIFIVACLVYNSSLYAADGKNGNEREQKDLVHREAICLLFLVLVTIGGTLFFLSRLSDLKISTDRLTLLLFVVALVVALLVYLIYYFGRLIYDPASAIGRQSLSRRQAGVWLIFLLVASYIAIPYLWGEKDANTIKEDANTIKEDAKLTKKTDLARVRVTIRQNITTPNPVPCPVRLIGTTSSFHFFYYPATKQVFIVPTANIASLEFKPLKDIEKSDREFCETSRHNAHEIANAISNISGPGNHCASGWKKLPPIQSFPEAKYKLDDSRLTELTELSTKLKSPKDKTLQQLMLIGRADAKPLGGQMLQAYGSNNGLAQARAKWVWEELKAREVKIDPQRVILLSAGPLHVGEISGGAVSDPDEKKRAEDRSVEIHACWAPKPAESAESTP